MYNNFRKFSSGSVESFCPDSAFNEFVAACWIPISCSDICFLLGAVGDASSFNSILQFNSGELLHSKNLLLCIESDLRFLFCRYLGPYLGFWQFTCTDFGSFIPLFVLFLTTFSRKFVSCSVESFCPNTAFQWIYCCVLNPNILIWHLFLARSCRRCFKFQFDNPI